MILLDSDGYGESMCLNPLNQVLVSYNTPQVIFDNKYSVLIP